jgi:hypothetical protein
MSGPAYGGKKLDGEAGVRRKTKWSGEGVMEKEQQFGLGSLAGLSADLVIGLRCAWGRWPWPDVPTVVLGRALWSGA